MFLHIDVDSFFASAERVFDPSLRGIPMAVGSRSNLEIFESKRSRIRLMNDNSGAFVAPVFYSDATRTFESYFVDDDSKGERCIRGIITSASYEARACGVKTAMPVAQALQCCPQMVVVPSCYPRYHRLSKALHRFICSKIPQVEQYSIDEFFADVSGWVSKKEVYAFASKLKEEIMQKFMLPVSIGISDAKWIAKLATESAKPYGVFMVEDIESYTRTIPIEDFPGIGKGFARKLKAHHIHTLGDIKAQEALFNRWKKPGIQLYKRVTGTDGEGISGKSTRKSIGISRTFDPIYDISEIKRRIMVMARHICYMAMAINANPTTYYLRVGYENGTRIKVRRKVTRIFSEPLFKKSLEEMFESEEKPYCGAIKLTVTVSDFTKDTPRTLSLLSLDEDRSRWHLTRTMQRLRERFGLDIIKTGSELY